MDLLRQFYVLPHWDRSCRSNLQSLLVIRHVGTFLDTFMADAQHCFLTSSVTFPRVPLVADLWLFVGCLTSQQHASVSQGRICSDNVTCCHSEIEVADQTFYLTQSQYTDTRPASPGADLIIPGDWHGSHLNANFWVTGMTRPGKIPSQAGFEPWIFRSRGRRLNH